MDKLIAFIDGDGVLWDNSTRAALATQIMQNSEYLPEKPLSIFFDVLLDARFVCLDTPIQAAVTALEQIEREYDVVFILSSNLEATRAARNAWLQHHGLERLVDRLLLKPEDKKYVKTAKWKAEMIEQCIKDFHAEQVLFVDDDANNLQAVNEMADSLQDVTFITVNSLTIL